MEVELILTLLKILGLAFVQSISFSIVSRSRNRDNKQYHIIASLVLWNVAIYEDREDTRSICRFSHIKVIKHRGRPEGALFN